MHKSMITSVKLCSKAAKFKTEIESNVRKQVMYEKFRDLKLFLLTTEFLFCKKMCCQISCMLKKFYFIEHKFFTHSYTFKSMQK